MNIKFKLLIVLLSMFLTKANADTLNRTKSVKGAVAYIISPKNGDVVSDNFTVKFGLKGMGVSPAGIDVAFTGHHHLLIDLYQLPDLNKPLGSSVMHFGGGQTEVDLQLSEGPHRLQLLLGDKFHLPHDPAIISEAINITVKK